MTNAEYVDKRNYLVSQAVKDTDVKIGKKPEREPELYYHLWNKHYFKRMTELAKKAGLPVVTREEIENVSK
jgi:cell division protein FtsL